MTSRDERHTKLKMATTQSQPAVVTGPPAEPMPSPAPALGPDDRSPGTPPAGASHRHALRSVAYVLIVVLTVAFSYLALRGVHLDRVWTDLRTSDYGWLFAALAAFALSTMARAVRWRALFAPERRPGLWPVTNAMLVGYLFNNVFPARAGEAARVVALNQRAGTPAAEAVGTVMVERVFDVLSILVIFFVASPWLPQVSWFHGAAVAAIVLAIGLGSVTLVLAVYGDRPVRLLARPLGRLPLLSAERVEYAAAELVDGLSGLRRGRVALSALSWSLAAWLLSALSAWMVTFAFHLHLGFSAGVLVVVAVGLAMILPSPPAAVGVFEAAALLALNAYGLSETRALPFALVLHMINFVPFIAVGAVVLHLNATHARRRRRAAGTPAGASASAIEAQAA